MDFSLLWAHRSLSCTTQPRYWFLIACLPKSFLPCVPKEKHKKSWSLSFVRKPSKTLYEDRWLFPRISISFSLSPSPSPSPILSSPWMTVFYVHIYGLWKLPENIKWLLLLKAKWEVATCVSGGIWPVMGIWAVFGGHTFVSGNGRMQIWF